MASKKMITREEFEKHNVLGDCWIEIDGKVYDVSEWMKKHPGGERLLECLGGRDASLPFLLNHAEWVRHKYLKSMLLGDLEPKQEKHPHWRLTEDFVLLYNELLDKGWFETSYAYYVKKTAVLVGMLCGVLYLFQLGREYDMKILTFIGACMTGIFWQQIAFIGHDLGHNGITHNVFLDSVFGLIIGNLGQGISIGWWKYTHNVHHVRTNDEEWDPDIQHMPIIAISKSYLTDIWSKFHRHKSPPADIITWIAAKAAVKYQHYHWLFTISSSRWFVYMSSLVFAVWQQPRQLNGNNEPFFGYNVLEVLTLFGYHAWTIALFYYGTDSPAFYYFVAYLVAGILHIQIIANHFPCEVLNDIEEDNFVLHQLKTSMAISSNSMTHWFYGGLQFQVEHHLFPMMPRHNLRKVKPYILELCKKHKVDYLENSFFGACCDIFHILKDVSKHSDKLNEISYTMHAHIH